jgi:hypothetical protein
MSTIIVGSSHPNTAEFYKKIGTSPSVLVNDSEQQYSVGHTSIQDIPVLEKLELVLSQADVVYWAESAIDEFYSDTEFYNFLNWIKDYNLRHKNIVNFANIKFDAYNWNSNFVASPDHAVFFGCSFTAGVGLSDPATHYATQVAQHFDKPLLNLALAGGSNNLVFDRFTQLNFHENQLVVVQLTTPDRIHYCNESRQLYPIMFSDKKLDKNLQRTLIHLYHKDFLFYEILVKMRALISMARAKKLRLVFWLINYKNNDMYSALDQTYFYDMKEFVPASWMANYMIDHAEDGLHPGIESNKFIANTLIKYIETVYEI